MFLNPCWQHSPALFPFSITRASWAHAHPAPAPAMGISLCTHLPAPRRQPTTPILPRAHSLTMNLILYPPPLDRFHCWCHLLPCHATPTTTFTFSPSFFSTTHVSHANTAASVLFQYNRPYHVATLHCTNCPNLRSGSRFCVLLSDPSLCSRTLSAACGSNLCGGYLHLQSQCCIGFTFFCLICFALVPTRGSRRLATETQLRLTAIPVHCASTTIARVSATTAGYLLLVCRNRHRIHLAQSQSKMHN